MTPAEKRAICMRHFDEMADFDSKCDANIEKYRKGGIKIKFSDRSGTPVSPKNVRIRQISHDFKYGANIFMLDEFSEEWENKAYRETFKKHFNLATVPFYWDGLEPEQGKPRYAKDSPKVWRRPAPDLCMEYCEENGILPKLHCLFYDKFTPDWLPFDDVDEMRRLYEKRFAEIAERYSGRMYEIEVTNELIESADWKKSVLPHLPGAVEWAFELAEKYFKNDKLVINEGTSTVTGLLNDGVYAKYYLQLEKLLAKGVRIDKIGVQNHIFAGVSLPEGDELDADGIRYYADTFMDPKKHFKALELLASFGLPLEITEVTLPTLGDTAEDEELQAELAEKMYKLWFSVPQIENVVYWNTVDKTGFVNKEWKWNENNCRAGLFHRDLTPKRSADKFVELFEKRWRTNGVFNAEDGEISIRGFFGDYEAEIDGKVYKFGIHKESKNTVHFEL